MPSRPPDSSANGPACPRCRATGAIQTYERFGERLFFCPSCEHSWTVRLPEPEPSGE